MLRTTPFHDRVDAANKTSLWSHWSGYLVVDKYQMAEKFEYVAIRNAAGLFDTSPLHKYRIVGPDAERYLSYVLTRDVRTCRVGQAQYTVWCDDNGYVNEDGVVFRHGDDEFLLTTAESNLSYLQNLVGRDRVEITDVSDDFGALSVQGPRSRTILAELAPEIESLRYFEHLTAKIGDAPVTVARSGFTGDLGYEVHVERDRALDAWDAIVDAGRPHGLLPIGQIALMMARIEAGLLLIHVDFESSRFAENNEHRSTPLELGLGWMLPGIDDDRRFVGRDAIRTERAQKTSRWKMMGLIVDWHDYDTKYNAAGLIPPKDHTPVLDDMMVYDDSGERVGYATSFMYSPQLQRHIALARVRPDLAVPGAHVNLEFTIDHRYQQVGAHVTRTPLFQPDRKTA